MKVKIAHCSDIHLNEFSDQNIFIRDAFISMLNECKNQKIDFLLISGDLFDNNNQNKIQWIKEEFEKFKIKTIISPGNHDPFTIDSPYKLIDWPENVFIFQSEKMEYIEDTNLNIRIWGNAFTSIYQEKSMLKNLNKIDDNFINICVIHGNITSSEHDYYNPIYTSDILKSNFDYIALGHIHKRTQIYKFGNTYYSYCGCLCSTSFSDTGEKGIYIGEISKGKCDLKFKKICNYTYEKISIDISKALNTNNILEIILNEIKSNFDDFKNNHYIINLIGTLEENLDLDIEYLETCLKKTLVFVKIKDSTYLIPNIKNIEHKNDFKSIFIKNAIKIINESKTEEEKILNKIALKIGLKSFTEDVSYPED